MTLSIWSARERRTMKLRYVSFVLLSGLVSPSVLLAREPQILSIGAPSTADCEALAASVVGLSQKAAERLGQSASVVTRVMRRGHQDQAGTTDFRGDRLNLNLDKGLVIAARCG